MLYLALFCQRLSAIYKMNNRDKFALSFIARFGLFLIFFQAVVFAIHQSTYLSSNLQVLLANLAASVYNLIGEGAYVEGNAIYASGAANFVYVDNECTGLQLLATLISLVCAFKDDLKHKLLWIGIIAILLIVINIIRISHLFYIAVYSWDFFELFHIYVWQISNFIVGLALIYTYHFFRNRTQIKVAYSKDVYES